MTEAFSLSEIFKDKHYTPDYNEILNDQSIKGKFKYIMNYSPTAITCGPANILVHYLIKNSSCNNTVFSFNGGQEGLLQRVKKRSKRKTKKKSFYSFHDRLKIVNLLRNILGVPLGGNGRICTFAPGIHILF